MENDTWKSYLDKYNSYFNDFEKLTGIKLEEWIKEYFINTKEFNYNIAVSNRRAGKYLLTHLLYLYNFYSSKSLDKVVYIGEYFYIVKEELWERKTPIYNIVQIGSPKIIGEIKWFSPWRKYCFFPYDCTVWDNKCILQMMNFMNKINLARYKDKEDN